MNFLQKNVLVSFEAVIFISIKQGERPVSAKDVCEYLGVSLRYLEQFLQLLVKSGILKSLRGAGGGYVLGRDRRKITLYDIFLALNKKPASSSKNLNSEIYSRVIAPTDDEVMQVAIVKMQQINLHSLYDDTKNISLSPSKKAKSDFII